MKRIRINNQDFYYESFDTSFDPSTKSYTHFYEFKDNVVWVKKYFNLFGPLIQKTENKYLFNVPFNIESPYYLKENVREAIEDRLKLLERIEQIKNGEII